MIMFCNLQNPHPTDSLSTVQIPVQFKTSPSISGWLVVSGARLKPISSDLICICFSCHVWRSVSAAMDSQLCQLPAQRVPAGPEWSTPPTEPSLMNPFSKSILTTACWQFLDAADVLWNLLKEVHWQNTYVAVNTTTKRWDNLPWCK